MAIWRLATSIGTETGLPRDRMVINPVVNVTAGVDNPQTLVDDWAAAFNSWIIHTTKPEITVKAYDVERVPHGPAAATKTLNPGVFLGASCPHEIALCLSFYSEFNVKRHRGRLYIPAALITGAGVAKRPTTADITKVMSLATALQDLGSIDVDWSVYSKVDDTARKVTHFWCDDEWDIQRHRGLRGENRQTGVTSEQRPVSGHAWSTRFLKLYVAGTTQVYTVPPGKRAVVKSISAYNAGSVASLAYVQLYNSVIWSGAPPGSQHMRADGLHHVAHSGETISGYIEGPTMNLTVCGYLLEDPSSSPAPNTEEIAAELLPLMAEDHGPAA